MELFNKYRTVDDKEINYKRLLDNFYPKVSPISYIKDTNK